MSLSAKDAWQVAVQDSLDLDWLEGLACSVDMACDPEVFCLGHVIGIAIEFLRPQRIQTRFLEVEEARVEDCSGGYVGMVGLNDPGVCV